MQKNQGEDNNKNSIARFHQVVDGVFDDVADGVADEISGIQSQISQIESLLKDAIASLHASFDGVTVETANQMQVLSSLMMEAVSQHDDTPNIFQQNDRAAEILKRFVDMLIDSSRSSLNALSALEGSQHRMGEMVEGNRRSKALLQNMRDLCDEKDEDVDMDALRAVLAEAENNQSQALQSMEQAAGSFSDSHRLIKEVASRDMDDVYQSKQEIETLLKHFYEVTNLIASCRTDVTEGNGRVRHHLGVAVRALQFEDITSQSLGHTRLHLERMEGFVLRMTQGLSNIDPVEADGVGGYADKITEIHINMMRYKKELALEERNPVSQKNLDEGEVELF
ncbi:MAG: hypothetical protein Q9M19_01970 [Mariprofundaceae bacterium]|nr:hypothetical protein [Mariprofundaceae bacterium]